MTIINLFDSNFAHAPGSVGMKTPREVQWVRGQLEWDGITIITDQWMFQCIADISQSTYKIGWLHEGRELRPYHYEMSKDVRHKFDAILTTDRELLEFDPEKYRPIIRGGVWTPQHEWGLHPKSKMVSMILSDKTQLSGHRLRHQIADTIPGIDLYGARGTSFGVDKAIALKDYRFSIIVEASRHENWFSEHLLDCIAFGTIPIYWGCPNIDDYLDDMGLIQFDTIERLALLLPTLSKSWYDDLLPWAKINLDLLPTYEITEDWILRNVLQPFLEPKEVAI